MSPKPLYFIGESVKSTTVQAHPAATFKEFVTGLSDEPHKLSITRAEFQGMDKAGRAAVKQTLPYFLPCTFKKSPWKGRTRENARLCNLICLDIDESEAARRFFNNPQLINAHLKRFNYFAYSTISSTPEQPRIRIVVEAKDIPPEQYASAVRTVARMLKVDKFDPASLNPVQPMFVPVIFKGECGLLDCPDLDSFFASRPFSVADIEHEERAEAASPSIQIVTDETAADGLESLPVAGITESDARRALATLNADMDYDDWVDVGMSLHHQFAEDGYELFDEWSASGSKYTASEETRRKWQSFSSSRKRPRTIRSLFQDALAAGWDGLLESGVRWFPKGDEFQVLRPLVAYPKNDLGNAEAIVAHTGDNFRYVPTHDNWLVWDGCRWQVDWICTRLHQHIDKCVRQWIRDAADIQDHDARAKALSRALSFGDKKVRQNALVMVKHQPMIIMPGDALDADPLLLGVPNGVLDLRAGVLLTNAREHHITKSISTSFDPSATCPQWEKFIERVTRGHAGLAEFLQRSIGYSLTGLTTEHVFWFLHGCGKNGKSVFIETMQSLSGEYGRRTTEKLLSISRFGDAPLDELAGLPGVRMIFGSETADGVKLNEKLVKDLTGGDTLRGRRLYKDGFDFRPVCKLWMFGNHKPEICGTDHGIWRRVLLVPFTACISNQEQDSHLAAKLRAELPGILNWALAGLRQYHEIGLAPPHCVTAATNEYKSDQDTLGDFIDECLERGQGFTASKGDLHQTYHRWAVRNGHRSPLTSKRLSRQLKERGFRELPSRMWAECRIRTALPFDDLEAFPTKLLHGE